MAYQLGQLDPLPKRLTESVEARVGMVEMVDGLPTQKGVEQLYEIQDFQRATQLYQYAIPAIGVMGWQRLYAPTEAYFDRSWPLPDIQKVA